MTGGDDHVDPPRDFAPDEVPTSDAGEDLDAEALEERRVLDELRGQVIGQCVYIEDLLEDLVVHYFNGPDLGALRVWVVQPLTARKKLELVKKITRRLRVPEEHRAVLGRVKSCLEMRNFVAHGQFRHLAQVQPGKWPVQWWLEAQGKGRPVTPDLLRGYLDEAVGTFDELRSFASMLEAIYPEPPSQDWEPLAPYPWPPEEEPHKE